MIEQWRDIPGWEGFYQASTLGRIRSLDRMVFAGHTGGQDRYRKAKGIILRPGYNKVSGYPYVMLCNLDQKLFSSVHALIARTFLGPCPVGLETRHLDGDPRNAALDNLAYGTHIENMADCIRHGTRASGERMSHAITFERAEYIRRRVARGDISQRKLAIELGINRASIMAIMHGRHWTCKR